MSVQLIFAFLWIVIAFQWMLKHSRHSLCVKIIWNISWCNMAAAAKIFVYLQKWNKANLGEMAHTSYIAHFPGMRCFASTYVTKDYSCIEEVPFV